MPSPFVVLALPRSRSCWLAHYLTLEGQYLIGHDTLVECASVSDFLGQFESKSDPMLGTVETGASLGWRLLRERLPKAKLLCLLRPLGEIVNSFARFGIAVDLPELEMREAMLQAAGKAPGVETIQMSDLSDPNCVKWLCEWLLDAPFDAEWYARLSGMNIQVNMLERSTRLFMNRSRIEALKVEVSAATARLPERGLEWLT